jgi:hypothetical protein
LTRVLLATTTFGFIGLAAFLAARHGDLIERQPLLALAFALLGVVTLRALAVRIARTGAAATSGTVPDAVVARSRVPSPVWVVAGCVVGAVALFFACGAVVRLISPRVGTKVVIRQPVPFFWSESAYFEYAARRVRGAKVSADQRAPANEDPESSRSAILAAGTKVVIKGWVENGAQVQVDHDPDGRLRGEWGYVYLRDLDVDR